ncbi:hemolysin [Clostridium muellerianum]|nr:hemolysin [Clostridium muellerianum]
MESSFREIVDMWKAHVKFNGWEVKNDDEGNNTNQGDTYKHVNIEDISFL